MVRFRDLPIKRKLNLIGLISTGAALLLTGVAFVWFQQRESRAAAVNTTVTLARMVAIDVAAPLSFTDADAATQSLQSLTANPQVAAARIYDATDKPFATYVRAGVAPQVWPPPRPPGYAFAGSRLNVFNDITAAGERIGTLFIQLDLESLHALLLRNTAIGVAALGGAAAVAWVFARRLYDAICGPMLQLTGVAQNIARDRDYAARAEKFSSDEVGQLVDVFNEMLTQIQARDADLENRVRERTRQLQDEISERERTQQQLAQSEFFLRKTQEVARLGSYALDVRTGKWTSSPVLREVFGIDEHHPHDVDSWVALIAPDDRESMRRYFLGEVLGARQRFDREYRIVRHRDGEERWVSGVGELELDASGQPIRMIGTILDITDRKRAELARKATEEKFRRLTEEISDVVWETDADIRVTYISPAYERVTGVRTADTIGHYVAEMLDEQASRRIAEMVQEYRTKPASELPPSFAVDTQTPTKDGKRIWCEIRATPFRDAAGRLIGFRGATRDISARKKAEEALRESEHRLSYERDQLEALLEASPDSIYFKDLQSRLVRVSRSKALKVIHGVPALRAKYESHPLVNPIELVRGLSDFDTYSQEDAQKAYDDEQTIIRTGVPLVNKLERQVFQDETVIWHLTNKMPWRDRDGKIIGTFGVSKDVTDLKQAEEALEKVHRQLVSASRQAGMAEVATGVLHNVGNALNSVNVATTLALEQLAASRISYVAKTSALLQEHASDLPQFLTEDPKGKKLPGYLASLAETLQDEHKALLAEMEDIRKNIEHVKEIVAMQQSYAHVAGVLEPVPLIDIVEDAIRMNSAALARHEVELVRDYTSRPIIVSDRHRILQILVNLLRNAKYACDDSKRSDKQIRIRIISTPDAVRVVVTDNGVGIPTENLVRIFSHGFTTRKGGHGFGLHSGALAAKELGGMLQAESAGTGQGATFTLELPNRSQSTPP